MKKQIKILSMVMSVIMMFNAFFVVSFATEGLTYIPVETDCVIDISGLKMPEANAEPDYVQLDIEGENFTVLDQLWTGSFSSRYGVAGVEKVENTFWYDSNVTYMLVLKANEGYYFDSPDAVEVKAPDWCDNVTKKIGCAYSIGTGREEYYEGESLLIISLKATTEKTPIDVLIKTEIEYYRNVMGFPWNIFSYPSLIRAIIDIIKENR